MNEENIYRIPHNCALKLQAVYGRLKTAEKKAADFILHSPHAIPDLAIVEFAERAGCSEATIVRLSKRIGYEGYLELRADFRANGKSTSLLDYRGLNPDDSPTEVKHKVFASAAQAIVDTENVIDRDAYEAALDALCAAKSIMFCAVGNGANVSQEAYHRWRRIGFPALHGVDHDLQLIMASQLKPGDVLVAISHSGQTRTLLDVVKVAANVGATIIAITNFPFSALAKRATFVLQTAVFSSYISGEVMSKRIAELCIIESLFVNFLIRQKDKYSEALKVANYALKMNKL